MGPIGFNFIGYIYYALGDLDSYFKYMNRAVEAHAIIAFSADVLVPLRQGEGLTPDTWNWWRNSGSRSVRLVCSYHAI